MPSVSLIVNEQAYAGWENARVTRSIETAAGSFDLEVSDRFTSKSQLWPIIEEDECTVLVGNQVLITGYVDKRDLSFGPDNHTLRVSGRDKAGTLVDCSALLTKWEFNSIPVLTLAQRVCKPFGVTVSMQPGLGNPAVPQKLSIDPGDSAFDVIEKACRQAGLLAISDGKGGIVLTRAGTQRCTTELVQGQNILSASAAFDSSNRFHEYRVLGQHHGTDNVWGPSAAHVSGRATDLNVRRPERVLLVRPEGDVTPAQAKVRAQWEATVRAARADTVSVTVQGWTQADGALWPINKLARVRASFLGVDGDMLITEATYSIGDNGTTTVLALKSPKAFKPEPTKPKDDNTWKEIRAGVKVP